MDAWLEKLNHIGSLVSAASAFTQDITHLVSEMLCPMRMGGRMCVDLTGSWIVGEAATDLWFSHEEAQYGTVRSSKYMYHRDGTFLKVTVRHRYCTILSCHNVISWLDTGRILLWRGGLGN